MPLTVGTAGHIDHGKTWLVRALTGKDTDRLPEERARGISIDLGYAPLELPDGQHLSLVDVPGHERFVRNMVAGATGIDLFLLVIDAGEGARPQTHEHLAIIRLLGLRHGVVALTKVDAVDEETRELAAEEARELVPGAPVVSTSARTGEGLDDLRRALADTAAAIEARDAGEGPTRLWVDRVFTLRGIGTVATGTLWSGTIGAGDGLVIEPGGRAVRVRSVQVHDRPVERAAPGQRVAVSLPGLERQELGRGDALVTPGAFRPSYRLDVELEELAPIAPGARVHVHHGTAQHLARVIRVGERYAQLRLASPAIARADDRVVVRERTTVGGGVVLDPVPPRHADPERFGRLARGEVAAVVHEPVRAGGRPPTDDEADLVETGAWVFSRAWLDELRAELDRRLDEADPLDPGVPAPTEPWAREIVPLLGLERRGATLYRRDSDGPALTPAAAELERAAAEAGFAGIKADDPALARSLERAGRVVRLGDDVVLAAAAYEDARRLVIEECERSGSIRLARLRDLLGTGRRPAQLLLERLDGDGVTRRVGDERVLRRRATVS